MKKFIAVAFVSALVAAPAFAGDASTKASANKKAAAHSHNMASVKDECDTKHNAAGNPQGHGMMGGHGSGMMGGSSMMGGGRDSSMLMELDMRTLGALALSAEQQAKITRLADELKHNNWTTQGLINDETAKLRDLYQADKRDPAAIGKEYQKGFDLKRQMIETYLDTENRVEEVLTPEQLAQVKQARQAMRHMYGHSMH